MSATRYWLLTCQYTGGSLMEYQWNEYDQAIARWEFAAFRAHTDWAILVEVTHYYTPRLGQYLNSTRQLIRATHPLGAHA